jgi:transposase
MKSVNRYYQRAKISERKFRQIVRYFAMDFTASDVAQLTGLTRKTSDRDLSQN